MHIEKDELGRLAPLELALFWAKEGMRVLPVSGPPAKRPLVKAWESVCTTDEAQIHEWWRTWPQARVGIATGDPGHDVLDFDVAGGKPGLDQLSKLIELGVIEPGRFVAVRTPSGGRHLYFKGSDQRNKQNEKAIPGVDFRGAGGMVLAAGNPGYDVLILGDPGPIAWDAVRAALAPPEPRSQAAPRPTPAPAAAAAPGSLVAPLRHFDDPIGEESPLDWYTRHHDIDSMLRDAGWTFVHESGGRRHYTRPGKEPHEGVSGNTATMPDGRVVFFNFSSSVSLPTDTALSGAQLYAWLEHGGDMRAAARHVRTTLMPQRPRVQTTGLAAPGANHAGVPGTPAPMAAPGTREIVPVREQTPEHIRAFWHQRPELREIWFQALETGYSPWAILGYALAMVCVRVGPHVQLPPKSRTYGGTASLNLFVAIVGDTGDGKDEAAKLARPFIGAPHVPSRKPGTGQGIAALFTEQTKDGPVQVNDTAYLHESEVSGLGAHADLQGSNLVSTLLNVYMAQELGEHYANKEKRRPVPEGRYRLAMTVGVQPSNSHILLGEVQAQSGLPQRFIWMPALWPDAILDHDLMPPAPGPVLRPWQAESWLLPGSLDDSLLATGWSPSDAASGLQSPTKAKESEEQVPYKEPVVVEYADALWFEMQRADKERRRARKTAKLAGERIAGAADSHLTLTRLKVAALLSIWLDRSTHVSWEMWELAGSVVAVSNMTRIEAQNELAKQGADQTARRAAARVAQEEIVEANRDQKHTALITKVSDRIRTVIAKGDGGWVSYREIALGLASRDKKALREAGIEISDILGDLVQVGVLDRRDPEGKEQGDRYRARA